MQKKLLSAFLVPAILVLLIFLSSISGLIGLLSDYLTKSERTDADLLIVEGWLPEKSILKAAEEFRNNGYRQIVTTGIYSSDPFVNIYSNGTLTFRTKKWVKSNLTKGSHTIDIEAKSELGGDGRAHFTVGINNETVGDFFAETSNRIFSLKWNGLLKDIDSITVRFDNDRINSEGDVNLYVKAIRIDHKIYIPYLNNSVYDIITTDGHLRMENNISSCAENARKRLILAGIDSSFITAVPAQKTYINRTLASALAFRSWLASSGASIKGINIVSEGPHSRRTWTTYNKLLHGKYSIGIIPELYTPRHNSKTRMIIRTLREAAGLLYYRIILLAY